MLASVDSDVEKYKNEYRCTDQSRSRAALLELTNLAKTPRLHSMILRHGIIPLFVDALLRNDEESSRLAAAEALGRLEKNFEAFQAIKEQVPIITMILNSKEESKQVKINSAFGMIFLAGVYPAICEVILSNMAAQPVMSVLLEYLAHKKDENKLELERIKFALETMITQPAFREIILLSDAISILGKLSASAPSDQVKKIAALALATLMGPDTADPSGPIGGAGEPPAAPPTATVFAPPAAPAIAAAAANQEAAHSKYTS